MDIKQLRASTGLSQKQFSDEFHIPVRTLQQWEQSKSSPPDYVPDMIDRLLAYKEHFDKNYSLDQYRIPPRTTFRICIPDPFPGCTSVYPIQQRKVRELIDDICAHTTPIRIIVFGSSVTEHCHIGSDVDIYADLTENISPIQNLHNFEYDFWCNFTVDQRLKKEILQRGVIVYGSCHSV